MMRKTPFTKKSFLLTIITLITILFVFTRPAYATLGWVGNMFPAGGSTNTITVSSFFDVYLEVYKADVTPGAGQGANISCTLYWATVPYFGGTWSNVTSTPMSYFGEVGNNDQYKVSISPGVGLYEFTAYCTDLNDSTNYWQGSGNGRFKVDTAGGSCNSADQNNNNIFWSGLGHNSFSTDYRSVFGAVTTSQGTVTLKFRTCMDDLNARPQVRIWNDRTDTESILDLDFDSHASDVSLGGVTFWKKDISIPATSAVLYYRFKAVDGASTAYYRDDDPKLYGGGWGTGEADLTTANNNSYQITVYDPAFATPGWLKDAVVYQIFPDRFRNGDAGNDPVQGGDWIYGQTVDKLSWNQDLCDPRNPGGGCFDEYSNQFYGGDLQGVINELDYLKQQGVTVIYLNPIFKAPSNHLYDAQDYLLIDPYFGSLATFQTLATEAENRGIKLILDGVFNHVSSDSKYFDRYNRWDASGNANSGNDQSGACESTASGWRSWFTFVAGPPNKCYDGTPGSLTLSYWDWAGYDSLAKLVSSNAAVRSYIYSGGSGSVARYWLAQGADGWRFDVGGDVDHGTATGDSNGFWAGYRTAAQTEYAGVALLGEEWGDSSSWLVGDQWDSVMNYRFRSAILSWMFDGCSGNGCTGGTRFQENDSNTASSSGPIDLINVTQFDDRLHSIQEDYPPEAWYAMMNLLDSHDTNRILYLLKKISNDSAADALNKFKFVGIFQFTYPGAPTIYYGNEAGLAPDAMWDGTWWQDDPYNRAPFPWTDQGRTPNTTLQEYFRKLAVLRNQYPVLRTGALNTLLVDNSNRVYAYSRTTGTSDLAVVVLNRHNISPATVSVSGLNSAFNGTTLYDVMNCTGAPVTCASYTVSGGGISNISVSALSGAVLVEGPLPAYAVTLNPAQQVIAVGGSTTLTAVVTNIGGEPAGGATVNFSVVSGSGNPSSATAVTNSSGQASVTLNDTYVLGNVDTLVARASVTPPNGSAVTASTTVFAGYNASITGISIVKTGIGPQTVALGSHSVVKYGLGEPVITLAQYSKNPISTSSDTSTIGYLDVHLSSATNVTSLTITFDCVTTCDATNDRLWWWDSANNQWTQAGGTRGVNWQITSDQAWLTVTSSTTPSLAQLNGTAFGARPGAPTAVTLLGFSGLALPGYNLLQWQTAFELNTLGFNIYRSTSLDGPRSLLNASPIPPKALGGPNGASYTFVDAFIQPGVIYYYWLEEIGQDGQVVSYGPVAVVSGYPVYLPLMRR